MYDRKLRDSQYFFERRGGNEVDDFTWEEIYQAFKARLLSELTVSGHGDRHNLESAADRAEE